MLVTLVVRRRFKNQNPARGRKRFPPLSGLVPLTFNLRTRTPQGDGNPQSAGLRCTLLNLRTRTPQGDGNNTVECYIIRNIIIFKNQNPARGRKHEALSVLMCAVMQFKNQNPARGRKRPFFVLKCFSYYDLRTRTPQGDGNLFFSFTSRCNSQFKNQNPARGRKPRKRCASDTIFHTFKNQNPARGRKLYPFQPLHLRGPYLRTRTPQGDGNRRCPSSPHAVWIFKNQNPARGRKPANSFLPLMRPPI